MALEWTIQFFSYIKWYFQLTTAQVLQEIKRLCLVEVINAENASGKEIVCIIPAQFSVMQSL